MFFMQCSMAFDELKYALKLLILYFKTQVSHDLEHACKTIVSFEY